MDQYGKKMTGDHVTNKTMVMFRIGQRGPAAQPASAATAQNGSSTLKAPLMISSGARLSSYSTAAVRNSGQPQSRSHLQAPALQIPLMTGTAAITDEIVRHAPAEAAPRFVVPASAGPTAAPRTTHLVMSAADSLGPPSSFSRASTPMNSMDHQQYQSKGTGGESKNGRRKKQQNSGAFLKMQMLREEEEAVETPASLALDSNGEDKSVEGRPGLRIRPAYEIKYQS